MTGPLLILAVFSLFGGMFGHSVDSFLSPVFGGAMPVHHENLVMETLPLLVGLLGIIGALGLYLTGRAQLEFAKQVFAPIYDLFYNKYYVDEIYHYLIVVPVKAIGKFLEDKAEKDGIDFSVDQVGKQVREASRGISIWQSGNVRLYALNMVAGVIAVLLFVIFL
jgi:NADH-quinone oxidoreductase subunit L